MKFKVYLQLPYPRKKPVIGSLNVDGNREAVVCYGERSALKLNRPRLEFISMDGICLSGMEDVGADKFGATKFRYQKWWCVPQ